ncbi:MAG: ATP-grasp domain-containing protein [Anaerolineae bacterium]|nr:ATP-grasp domain-containing protein [Anaerolineae bacterium]
MSTTLILSPWETEDSIAMAGAAQQMGWNMHRLARWSEAQSMDIEDDICVYGERLFVVFIAQHLPVVYLEPPDEWMANLPVVYVKRKIDCMTLGETRHVAFPAFIKPTVDKAFSAGIFNDPSELPAADCLPDHLPVLVSEIVSWQDEYRCFIMDGKVRTLSVYFRGGKLVDASDGSWPITQDEYREAKDFAQEVLDATTGSYPPGFVLDVGRIDGRGWAVIETNPANASGIYGCDPLEVLKVVRASCISKAALTPAEERWVQAFVSWDIA